MQPGFRNRQICCWGWWRLFYRSACGLPCSTPFALLAFWTERGQRCRAVSGFCCIPFYRAWLPLWPCFPMRYGQLVLWTPFPYLIYFPASILINQPENVLPRIFWPCCSGAGSFSPLTAGCGGRALNSIQEWGRNGNLLAGAATVCGEPRSQPNWNTELTSWWRPSVAWGG